ncbi:MAG: hypothetical protein K2I40_03360, partial [Bifidobacterium castoris]|nr:hypothetical protein [Bifidobacterium castoris]
RRASVLDGISKAQGALPRAAKVVSRVGKSQRADELDAAFDTPSTLTYDHADRILRIVREAARDGVDIERDLRMRLREVETAVAAIEAARAEDDADGGLDGARAAGADRRTEGDDDADQ